MHVHRVTKGGKVYKYHRYTRRPLPNDIPEGHPEFIRAYAEADKFRPRADAATLADILRDYRVSAAFTTKAASTRRVYGIWLKRIEGHRIASLPVEALDDKGVKAEFIGFRDGMAATPATAGQVMAVLKEALSHAVECGVIENNHAAGIGSLYEGGNRGELYWGADAIERFLRLADADMRRVFLMALETGQRKGDLLRLTWTAYDGEFIRLTQGKTRAKVEIPVTKLLRGVLEEVPRTCLHILTQDGRPWTSGAFDKAFQKVRAAAGLQHLHFHDTRGTFVVRCDDAGCTTQQICAITGHSEASAAEILKAYRSRRQLASAAIRRLENSRGTETVNHSVESRVTPSQPLERKR